MQKRISFKINKGPKFALEIVKEETDLTADMIARYIHSEYWRISATYQGILAVLGKPKVLRVIISPRWVLTPLVELYIHVSSPRLLN